MTLPIWIDTDPAVGVPGADVDDGYAIVQALGSPEVEVVGVSTVFGNAPLDVAHPIAEELLGVTGGDVSLHRGAAAAGELGEPTAASSALAAALERRPLTVVALGPLTNVATALAGRPELAARVERLVVVGGRRPGQAFLVNGRGPLPDFNIQQDPEAARRLLAAPIGRVLLAGFEVATSVTVTPAHLDRLAAGPPAARWLVERTGDWLSWWRERLDMDGFHPFDTLAMGAVTSPGLIRSEPWAAAVVEDAGRGPDWRGDPAAPLDLQAAPGLPGGRPVDYAVSAGAGFVDDLIRRVLAVG